MITMSGSMEKALLNGPDASSSNILTDQVGYCHVASMTLFLLINNHAGIQLLSLRVKQRNVWTSELLSYI